MNEREKLEATIIQKGYLGEDSLPVMGRMANDPGEEYFAVLKKELRQLFEFMEGEKEIDRTLAAGLFGLSHIAYTQFEAAKHHGVKFRDSLFDPDLIEIEMAVDSIFGKEWITL